MDQSKEHPATPRRLEQARLQGQVAASQDLAHAASLMASVLCVLGAAPWAAQRIAAFQASVHQAMAAPDVATVHSLAISAMALIALLSALPLATAALVHLGVTRLQTGSVWTLRPVQPDLSRLDPAAGLKRLVSLRSLVRTAMLAIRAGVVGFACFLVSRQVLGDAVRLGHADASAALGVASHALFRLLAWAGGAFLLLAMLDMAYQRWQFLQDMRMSTTELKRELRDSEGDTKLRAQRRQMASQPTDHELLDMLHAATLALTDGEGRVVVLVHRPQLWSAPMFMLRANHDFAQTVMQRLATLRKPLVTESRLARSLFSAAMPGTPVPELWLADVLAHLAQASQRRPTRPTI